MGKVRLIELFAGYGSQAMRLKRMGIDFEHYKVIEFDKYAIASYNAVHSTNFPATDIKDITGTDLEIKDTYLFTYLLTYSFPCTDLSNAGKRQGMDKGSNTRSSLLWEVERLLKEIKDSNGELPQILVMENVPQVHNKANRAAFDEWQRILNELGYTNYWQDLNAKDYGVRQNRNRCFMISLLNGGEYKFPQPIPLQKTLNDYLEQNVDEKYYLKTEKATKLLQELATRESLSEIGSLASQQSEAFGCGYIENISKTLKANKHDISLVKKVGNIYGFTGGNYAGSVFSCNALSPTLTTSQGGLTQPSIVAMRGRNPQNPSDRTAGVHTEQRLELNKKGLCNTLTTFTKDNYCLTEMWQIRKLTPREYGRLMDVNDEDISKMAAVNSNTQLYKQFGNSIVVAVLVAVFSNLNI